MLPFSWRAPRARTARRRRLGFETLEDRRMFAVGSLPATSGVSATIGTSTVTVASAVASGQLAVNDSDLALALLAGSRHLQNILNPETGKTPYFALYALTKSQAQTYGDYDATRPSTASFVADRHFTSNVAGKALYALLLDAQVTGVAPDPEVLSALTATVLKSLHKPRNGNWSDLSPANAMITGLASDPRAAGLQRFDVTYLYNMGAGFRGALALATLSSDPTAKLSGYLWSAQELFETMVHNLRQYYVYGVNPIGGQRVYDWEFFRKQLKLQGGDKYDATLGAELQSSWSGLLNHWANADVIDSLVKYYEATGHRESLALAKELADYAFNWQVPVNAATAPTGHAYWTFAQLSAYSRLALATGDATMMNRVRSRYEALRTVGFMNTGWTPEYFDNFSDTGELSNTSNLIDAALNFARWGWTNYYNDVERFTRGTLLPAQLLDSAFVKDNLLPLNDAQRNIADRLIGAFGFAAPYGAVATLNPHHTGGYFTDVSAAAVTALSAVKAAAYRFANGVHQINLLFDVENEQIRIVAPDAQGDSIAVTPKASGDLLLRLPDWASRSAVLASIAGRGFSYAVEGDYLRIVAAQAGTTYAIALPSSVRRESDVVNGRKIEWQWNRDEIASMTTLGSPLPFFANLSATGAAAAKITPVSSAGGTAAQTSSAQFTVSAGSDLVAKRTVLTRLAGVLGSAASLSLANRPVLRWTTVSGPAAARFLNDSVAGAYVSFSQTGVYTLRLTATRGSVTKYDEIVVTVV